MTSYHWEQTDESTLLRAVEMRHECRRMPVFVGQTVKSVY